MPILTALAAGLGVGAAKKGLGASARGAFGAARFAGGLALKGAKRFPRATAMGAVGLGAFGVHRTIQGISHSENLEQYYRSRFGDNEETTRAISSMRSAADLASAGVFTAAGIGVLGGFSTGASHRGFMSSLSKGAGVMAKGGGGFVTSMATPMKKPFRAGFMYGGVMGTGAALAGASIEGVRTAPEGFITSIGSGNSGAAALQFSTQGLPLRIHQNRRRTVL